ncbi:Cell division control protein 2 homolog C [Linum perenne]
MDNYQILEQISDGTYGEVHRAIVRSNGEVVALKKIKLNKYNSNLEPLDREIELLELLKNSSYIVRLIIVLLISVECVDAHGNPIHRNRFATRNPRYISKRDIVDHDDDRRVKWTVGVGAGVTRFIPFGGGRRMSPGSAMAFSLIGCIVAERWYSALIESLTMGRRD